MTPTPDAPGLPGAAALVSVVIPTWNSAATLPRAIDSVLAQTWPHCELIVVDDGGSDDTPALLAGYGARLRALRQANAGPAAARNHGLREARGDYVAFLDADDYWLPEKLECQVALLGARPEIGFCSTATRVVDARGEPVRAWPCHKATAPLLETLFMHSAAVSGSTSGVLARRELLLAADGFDARLRGFEDPDLWIRLAARADYVCIPEALTVVTRMPNSVSGNLDGMCAATLASFAKNRGLLPVDKQGSYWRAACAGALADYAKGAYRAGRRRQALIWLLRGLRLSPLRRGRLLLGLLLAMFAGEQL